MQLLPAFRPRVTGAGVWNKSAQPWPQPLQNPVQAPIAPRNSSVSPHSVSLCSHLILALGEHLSCGSCQAGAPSPCSAGLWLQCWALAAVVPRGLQGQGALAGVVATRGCSWSWIRLWDDGAASCLHPAPACELFPQCGSLMLCPSPNFTRDRLLWL